MRGTTLATLRNMLRAEVGQTANTTASAQNDNSWNQLLSNKQNWYACEYDWPFLENRWDLTCAPGSQYLALPTNPATPGTAGLVPNFERPIKVEVLFNTFYQEVCYGIGSEQYNILSSADGDAADPIQRWRFASNTADSTADRVEIWPIPVTQQVLRFTGQRALNVLYNPASSAGTNDARKADLDDLLLVLAVATDLLVSQKDPMAQVKAGQTAERLNRIRASYSVDDYPIIIGGGTYREKPRLTKIIAIS